MASFKLNFLLCSVLLMSLQAQATPQTAIQSVEDVDLMDLLKKVVKVVEQILDTLLADGEAIIDNITDDSWNDFRIKTVNITEQALGVVLDQILKDVNSMAEQSTDAAKNLSSCISSSRKDILDVPLGFWDSSSQCFGADSLALVKTLSPLIRDLEGVEADAKKVFAKLYGCQSNDLLGLLCLAQVAGDLLGVLGEIPAAITEDIKATERDLEHLIRTAVDCIEVQVPIYFDGGGKVLDKVSTCVSAATCNGLFYPYIVAIYLVIKYLV